MNSCNLFKTCRSPPSDATQTPVYLSEFLDTVVAFPICPSLEAYVFCKFQYLACLPSSRMQDNRIKQTNGPIEDRIFNC